MAKKNLFSGGLARPKQIDDEMDKHFDQIAASMPPQMPQSGLERNKSGEELKGLKKQPKSPAIEKTPEESLVKRKIDTSARASVGKDELSVKDLLASKAAEPEGYVRRNFAVKSAHMFRIKELTMLANKKGKRATQDDIINGILDEYFADS